MPKALFLLKAPLQRGLSAKQTGGLDKKRAVEDASPYNNAD